MGLNWDDIKWIFKPDGTLRDLYILETTIEDWKIIVNHLNENYKLRFENIDEDIFSEFINWDYVCSVFENRKELDNIKFASIFIGKLKINTHFFCAKNIEFDIDPTEINESNFKFLLHFMENLSRILKKNVILSEEFGYDYFLLKTNSYSNMI